MTSVRSYWIGIVRVHLHSGKACGPYKFTLTTFTLLLRVVLKRNVVWMRFQRVYKNTCCVLSNLQWSFCRVQLRYHGMKPHLGQPHRKFWSARLLVALLFNIESLRVLGQQIGAKGQGQVFTHSMLQRATKHFFARKSFYTSRRSSWQSRMSHYLQKTKCVMLPVAGNMQPLKACLGAPKQKDNLFRKIVLLCRWRRSSEIWSEFQSRAGHIQAHARRKLNIAPILEVYWKRYRSWAGHVARSPRNLAAESLRWSQTWNEWGNVGALPDEKTETRKRLYTVATGT